LNFEPGEEYTYSNSGYFLLGVIVKRASGESLREFAEKNIFEPLGMKSSRFHDDFEELLYNRATGYYERGQGRYKNFMSTFDCVGSGGLFTSVEDLFLWDQNFIHQKVGGERVMKLMHTQGMLNDGKKMDYAFGLNIRKYRGLNIVEHGGSLGGYRSVFLRFPDQRFSVIILSNLDRIVPGRLALQVADLYLANDFKEEEPTPKKESRRKTAVFEVDADILGGYKGEFFSPEVQATFQIEGKGERLYLHHPDGRKYPMLAQAEDRYRARGWTIQFIRNAENKVDSFRLSSGRVRNLLFTKK
jgi:CubicO group peptidase (beta-lactamase class C family)